MALSKVGLPDFKDVTSGQHRARWQDDKFSEVIDAPLKIHKIAQFKILAPQLITWSP